VLATFDGSFPEKLPLHFRKVSVHVLRLREQERHLTLTNRFSEAVAFHTRSETMELGELDRQRARLKHTFDTQRRLLEDRHAAELQCFEAAWARHWQRFDKNHRAELDARRQVVANLERCLENVEGQPMNPENLPLCKDRLGSRRAVPRSQCPTSPANVNPSVRRVAASRINMRPVFKRNQSH
jgi:hypothetical protein